MSITRTTAHALLAASLTLATFVGLPMAFLASGGPMVQERLDSGLSEGDPVASQVVLDPVDLGLAEPAPAEEPGDVGTELALMGSDSGQGVIRHGTRPPPRVRGTLSPKPTRGGGGKCVQAVDGVTALSTSHYQVARSLVRSYASDLDALQSLASVRQHTSGGSPDGYRLARVGCQSPLRAAGFRRGDVVHEVNGRPVTNTREAMRALTRNRKAERLEVVLTRGGRTQTVVFDVV